MIKHAISIVLVLFFLNSFGQSCGGQLSSGLYHNPEFINESGDTLNKLNKNGLYQGLHVYSDDKYNVYNDSIDHTIGNYNNGVPVGLWKEQCETGFYSIGMYSIGGGELSTNENGDWIEKKQGIYNKTGEWKYFNPQDSLLKIEKYKRSYSLRGWTTKTYLKVNGENVLVEFTFNSRNDLKSRFKSQTHITYRTDKSILKKLKSDFFKEVEVSYYPNGQIRYFIKCKKFLGRKRSKSIYKKYNEEGQLLKFVKGKC